VILLDLLILAYIAYSVWRGRKRGIIVEAPGAVSVVVFFFSGWGLLKLVYRGLASASETTGQSAGLLTFVGLIIATLIIWRRIRRRIRGHAEKLCPEDKRQLAGGIASGVKAFLLAAIVLLVCAHGPLRGVTRWIAEGSLLGRGLIRFVLPVYGQNHGAR